jgi:hypothetical protein
MYLRTGSINLNLKVLLITILCIYLQANKYSECIALKNLSFCFEFECGEDQN